MKAFVYSNEKLAAYAIFILRLTLGVIYFSCVAALFFKLWQKRPKPWRYLALVATLSLYFLVARFTSSPEEQTHFLEYGLVGVLLLRAINPVSQRNPRAIGRFAIAHDARQRSAHLRRSRCGLHAPRYDW